MSSSKRATPPMVGQHFRLPEELLEQAREAAQRRHVNLSVFVRTAILHEIAAEGHNAHVDGIEDRISAQLRNIHASIKKAHGTHIDHEKVVLAFLEHLTKLFVFCVPEPTGEHADAARKKVEQRYRKFEDAVHRSILATTLPQTQVAEFPVAKVPNGNGHHDKGGN